jgi:hypothetical protein
MKRTLALLLLLLCMTVILPTPARADGGGWPTATPTITPTGTPTSLPTYTPLPPTAVTTTPTSPYPYPGSMITPPALTPLPDESGKLNPNAPVANSAQADSQTTSQTSNNLLGGGVACWPIAIIALLVGVAILNWMRTGIRKGN